MRSPPRICPRKVVVEVVKHEEPLMDRIKKIDLAAEMKHKEPLNNLIVKG